MHPFVLIISFWIFTAIAIWWAFFKKNANLEGQYYPTNLQIFQLFLVYQLFSTAPYWTIIEVLASVQLTTISPSLVLSCIFWPLFFTLIYKKFKINFRSFFTVDKVKLESVLILLLFAVLLSIFARQFDVIVANFITLKDYSSRNNSELSLQRFLSRSIIAPLAEELLMRGIILRGLMRRYKPKNAILLSAIIFSLWHINPPQLMPTFIYGIALGWVAYRFGSIIPSILVHFIINTFLTFKELINLKPIDDIVSYFIAFENLKYTLLPILMAMLLCIYLIKINTQKINANYLMR